MGSGWPNWPFRNLEGKNGPWPNVVRTIVTGSMVCRLLGAGCRSTREHSLCSRGDSVREEEVHPATPAGVLQGAGRNGDPSQRPGGSPLHGTGVAVCVWLARGQGSLLECLTPGGT